MTIPAQIATVQRQVIVLLALIHMQLLTLQVVVLVNAIQITTTLLHHLILLVITLESELMNEEPARDQQMTNVRLVITVIQWIHTMNSLDFQTSVDLHVQMATI